MGDAIDGLSRALASGASRRATFGGVLAGAAAFLPWTAAANRKKRRRRAIKRYLRYCEVWCDERFEGNEAAIQDCIAEAEQGKGPCYSRQAKGPGHFCLRVKECGRRKYCCPVINGGGPVTDGSCCEKGTFCAFVNGTVPGELCVA